jgi:hypothetical protein
MDVNFCLLHVFLRRAVKYNPKCIYSKHFGYVMYMYIYIVRRQQT